VIRSAATISLSLEKPNLRALAGRHESPKPPPGNWRATICLPACT
jgi:hypothetical protein